MLTASRDLVCSSNVSTWSFKQLVKFNASSRRIEPFIDLLPRRLTVDEFAVSTQVLFNYWATVEVNQKFDADDAFFRYILTTTATTLTLIQSL